MPGMDDRSFRFCEAETPSDWRKSVYYHYYDRGHGVPRHYGLRTERYTLARFYETDEWELYDLKKDPQQLGSVYSDTAYAETLVELKAELNRLRTKFKDTSDQEPLPTRKRRNRAKRK